jgi:hypothetical protein
MRSHIQGFLPVLALAGLATVPPANAESYPVCLSGGSSDQTQCGFVSLAQCRATASGGLGNCTTDPAFRLRSYAKIRGRLNTEQMGSNESLDSSTRFTSFLSRVKTTDSR